MARVGQTVKEGDAEFTIKKWKCGDPSVGKDYTLKKAQGMFCIADVVYKNLGKESKLFDTSALTARQGETKFAADSMASINPNTDAAGGASSTFLEQVNPGNSVSGKVVFDVPKTAKVDTVYVRDGFTGEGTPIKVG